MFVNIDDTLFRNFKNNRVIDGKGREKLPETNRGPVSQSTASLKPSSTVERQWRAMNGTHFNM